jgi:hypothetical protein
VNPVHCRDWEDYGFDSDRQDSPLSSGDIDLALAELMKGLSEIADGDQDDRLFKRPAGKMLRELLSDPRLAGCQHFAFKEYKDASGARIIWGRANCSVSFQLAQLRVGKDTSYLHSAVH